MGFIGANGITDNTFGDIQPEDLAHSFKIAGVFEGNPAYLGTLKLYSKPDIVMDRVILGFYFIVVSAIIKSLLLWFLLVFAFHKFLSKPIYLLSKKVEEIDFDNIQESELINYNSLKKEKDELELFSEKFAIMLNKLNNAKKREGAKI